MSDAQRCYLGDARAAYLRGLVAQALAREVTCGADALVAAAYAAAIARNAKLRARFRRATRIWDYHPRWLRNPHHHRNQLECWGENFARGREPDCYVYGARLLIGMVEWQRDLKMGRDDERDVAYIEHRLRGDAPCCVCPSDVITRCLTHWHLFHAGAAGCFRCVGHAAACGPGRWAVSGPLWEGRKTPGFAWPTLPPLRTTVINFD